MTDPEADWKRFLSYASPGKLFVLLQPVWLYRPAPKYGNAGYVAQPGETIWVASKANVYKGTDLNNRTGFRAWAELDVYHKGDKARFLFVLRDSDGWAVHEIIRHPERHLAPFEGRLTITS